MAASESAFCCPDCGAPLSLFAEPNDLPGDGVLVCEHGHVYELDNPDDDHLLQVAHGPAYRAHLCTLTHGTIAAPSAT